MVGDIGGDDLTLIVCADAADGSGDVGAFDVTPAASMTPRTAARDRSSCRIAPACSIGHILKISLGCHERVRAVLLTKSPKLLARSSRWQSATLVRRGTTSSSWPCSTNCTSSRPAKMASRLRSNSSTTSSLVTLPVATNQQPVGRGTQQVGHSGPGGSGRVSNRRMAPRGHRPPAATRAAPSRTGTASDRTLLGRRSHLRRPRRRQRSRRR